jgi:FkbH-like protein
MATFGSEDRKTVDRLLSESRWSEARFALETLWRQQPTASTAQFVLASYGRMRGALAFEERRLAILRSFTVEPIVPMLRASSLVLGGVGLTVETGDFNTYAQEIMSPESFLYRFEPHAVILVIQSRDLVPEIWYRYTDLSEDDENQAVERALRNLHNWIGTFRARSTASLLVHNLEHPAATRWGLLDSIAERSQGAAIRRINDGIRNLARTFPGVYPFDYDALVARHGRYDWHDEQKWLTVRFPIAANHAVHLAEEWARYLMPIFGRTAKVLVTDLDNTLWRGVVGEDGPKGILMDGHYPGAMHRNLQCALLDLHHRGILLAIASKNNEADALEILDHHPDMILRPQHFAAVRCNWLDKAQNLRSIAEELNVGLDSLVFLDDNPAERDLVRQQLPEVTVIELPSQPAGYARIVQEFPLLQRLSLSGEDKERTAYYATQRQRQELQNHSSSLEDFYRELQQRVEIRCTTRETIIRVAQLTQKTNQFNLTTRRYTEAEIAALLKAPDVAVYEIRLRDRFADSGIVGVCITRFDGTVSEIDTLLLSCRVIGRTVETAVLSFAAQQSALAGACRLQGWFCPTKKNGPAKDFYPRHGFELASEEGGKTLWSLDPRQVSIDCPSWISLTHETQNSTRDTVYSN